MRVNEGQENLVGSLSPPLQSDIRRKSTSRQRCGVAWTDQGRGLINRWPARTMLSQNQEETRSAAAAGLLFMAAPGPSEPPAEGADEELSSKRLRLDAPRFDKENVLSPRRAIPDRQVGVLAPIASVIGQDAAGVPSLPR